MTDKEKEEWETLAYKMAMEGFDYCFIDYSSWKEIKDPEFQKLREQYVEVSNKLRGHVEQVCVDNDIETDY